MSTINHLGYNAYPASIQTVGSGEVFLAESDTEGTVIVASNGLGFKNTKAGGGLVTAPLNHENAEVLRALFPFTAPVPVLRKTRSFGLGDRLGIAGPGHLQLCKNYDVYPVLAQQSIRELNLTGRTYEDVLDAASFAVFREGYTKGFGADGDHLKTTKDIEYALSLGFSMITLDCSDHIKTDVTASGAPPLSAAYSEKYLGKTFDISEQTAISFSEPDLKRIAGIYSEAITFAVEIYNRYLKDKQDSVDFEISIDETTTPTTPQEHYFVARELIDAGVHFVTIAPRFCGEFQKGIDYIGDLAQFEKEIKIHAVIARHFHYKLSIHSGSDKFSVFPAIGRETGGNFHVKTAGTNWLLAMRIAAETDPALYRKIHAYALESFGEATKYYHVTTEISRIPDLASLKDAELGQLFDQNDARQLIHITYGLILTKKDADGSYSFRDALYKLWKKHDERYAAALIAHIGKHFDLLGIPKV